ncbi:MAG: biotin/lipoyl-binding protein [Candidatus Brocadiae bacterium]|nr:biotin/lipoyl-binding protein [Candidatus Brocadiia bacterium]
MTVRHGDDVFTVEVAESDGGYTVSNGGRTWHVRLDDRRGAIRTAVTDNGRHRVGVARRGESWELVLDGISYEFTARDTRFEKLLALGAARSGAAGRAEIRAPIPGLITTVLRNPGDPVAEGEPVLVLAAMKLENEIRSPRAGKLVEVRAKAGAAVEKGELLAVVE